MSADGADKTIDQYLSWYQIETKSIIWFKSNEILKTLTTNFNMKILSPWTSPWHDQVGGNGIAHMIGPICIIIPKTNQISGRK